MLLFNLYVGMSSLSLTVTPAGPTPGGPAFLSVPLYWEGVCPLKGGSILWNAGLLGVAFSKGVFFCVPDVFTKLTWTVYYYVETAFLHDQFVWDSVGMNKLIRTTAISDMNLLG